VGGEDQRTWTGIRAGEGVVVRQRGCMQSRGSMKAYVAVQEGVGVGNCKRWGV
jgi:hypothetical protein